MEQVILANEQDEEIGIEEKLRAHQRGLLHRAFSVLVFNSRGELMLQKRAKDKYHSGGLWSNTCCLHPRPGETTEAAAHRRLKEEMGIDCPLEEKFSFVYKKEYDNGLTEHEYDHVFVGECDDEPKPNKEEVEDWKLMSLEDIKKDLKKNPDNYTVWFKMMVERL